MVPARREVRVLNDVHDWNLPESDHYDTLAGLILHETEEIPDVGAVIAVGDVELVVRAVEENRVMWVEFWPNGNA
jgi:Mg2+/Co2+ transporter CorB